MATLLDFFTLTPQEMLYGFALPFIIVLVIFFAVLQMIRVFSRKINLIISLIVTILAATTPIFSTIATWLGHYTAYTALAAFVVVFAIGIGAWVFRRGREYTGGLTSADSELKRLYKRRAKLFEEIERMPDDSRRASKYDELEHLDKRIRHLELAAKHHYRR